MLACQYSVFMEEKTDSPHFVDSEKLEPRERNPLFSLPGALQGHNKDHDGDQATQVILTL